MGRSRGNSLFLVVIMMLVVGITLNAAVRMTQNAAFQASSYHSRAAADLLLESCLLATLTAFENDPEWNDGFEKITLGDQPGHYTVHFFDSLTGSPGPEQSVNNLKGEEPVDGPRGPSTVAPGTAHLVIVAQVGPIRKTVETIVYRPRVEDFVVNDVGLVSESSMEIQGDIDVYGLTSLSDPERVPAGLHANGRGLNTGDTSLRWMSGPTNTAEITGVVSTTQGIIDFGTGSATVDGGFSPGVARVPPPVIDVGREVSRRSDLTSGGLTSGVGETTLGAEEFCVNTDLTMNGDLILNDTTLYVNGDLFVNGTIKGTGSVFVDGDTSFFGDAVVSENNLAGVAVFSSGYIRLKGFSGGTFMDALSAGDPIVATAWTKAQDDVSAIHTTLGSLGAGSDDGDDAVRDWLDGGGGNSFPTLRNRVAPLPGETARFLEEKFDHLSGRFAGVDDGYFEEISEPDAAGPNGGLAFLERISYDKLGYSFFQGIVYSQTGLVIENEVEVLGSIWATGDVSKSPLTVNGAFVGPGDVLMNNGAKIVLVSEYGRSLEEVNFGSPTVTSWVER